MFTPPRSCNVLTITFTLALWPAQAVFGHGDDPPAPRPATVRQVEKAEADDLVYFSAVIERPADMRTPKRPFVHLHSSPGPPPVADLFGTPPWQCPCYAEVRSAEDAVESQADALKFVGRCPPQDMVQLTLRYPAKRSQWNQRAVGLDLRNAAAHPDAAKLRRRWAESQAAWLDRLGGSVGDFGGFLAYARQQTRRQYGLSTPRERDFDEVDLLPDQPDELLFDVMTGALAVQESLQLDRLRNPTPQREERTVEMEDIKAVEVKSHPFDRMRDGREPVFSNLARLVPADNYYLRFNNLNKLRELLDFANEWGPSLLQLAEPVGADYELDTRTRRQLCLPDTMLARLLGPAVIKELAVTGSDPYLREGSDVSILFDVRSRDVFQQAVDRHFHDAAREHPEAVKGSENYRDIPIESLVGPRRIVSCYRCWLGDVCLYSNSFAAAKRIIDVYAQEHPALADAPDFQYIRAVVFPLHRETEDGFLYLSDAFIRRLVGPELRIREKRRIEAVTSLKILQNAALYHGFQHGPGRVTLDELVAGGSLRAEDLYDPDGGTFAWEPDERVARSSTYGELGFLTPLVEIDSGLATKSEREQYRRFRENYESYWRNYFDPIAVRIGVDRTIKLEVCILPLIRLSAYHDFLDLSGGKPISVDLGEPSSRTLLRLVLKLREGRRKREILGFFSGSVPGANLVFDWIGDRYTLWLEDSEGYLALMKRLYPLPGTRPSGDFTDEITDFFKTTLVFGVRVKNPMGLVGFLMAFPGSVSLIASEYIVFRPLEPYQGTTIVQIAPNPSSGWFRHRSQGKRAASQPASAPTSAPTSQLAVSEEGPALYYAPVGDFLYFSTQANALRRLIDRSTQAATSQPAPAEIVKANLVICLAPSAAKLSRPALDYWLAQRAQRVSLGNVAQVYLLGRCGALDDHPVEETARPWLGFRPVCPDGGTYRHDPAADTAECSLHGSLHAPVRLSALPAGSSLGKLVDSLDRLLAYLRFTEDGLQTTVEIRRK